MQRFHNPNHFISSHIVHCTSASKPQLAVTPVWAWHLDTCLRFFQILSTLVLISASLRPRYESPNARYWASVVVPLCRVGGWENKEKSKLSASVAWWCTNAGSTLLSNQIYDVKKEEKLRQAFAWSTDCSGSYPPLSSRICPLVSYFGTMSVNYQVFDKFTAG